MFDFLSNSMLSLRHMLKTSVVTKKQLKTIDFDTEVTVDIPRISVREYMRNFKLYNEKVMNGASFIIAKNDADQVLISPPPATKEKKYCMKDLFSLKLVKFKSGDPHLSEKVDQIVYGI